MACPTSIFPPSGALASANYGQESGGWVNIPSGGVAQFSISSYVPPGPAIAFLALSVRSGTIGDAVGTSDSAGNNPGTVVRVQAGNNWSDILGWGWIDSGLNFYVKNYAGETVSVYVRLLGYS